VTVSPPDLGAIANPHQRHDFVLLFEVTNGNPNGDPDGGNNPRQDPETQHGLVTDVALKRKIRDYVTIVRGQPIFIQSEHSLNSLIAGAFRSAGVETPQVPLTDQTLIDWFEEHDPEGFSYENNLLTYGGESPRQRDIERILVEAHGEEIDATTRTMLRNLSRIVARAAGAQKIGPAEQKSARERLCRDYFDVRMFGAVLQTGLNAGQVRGPVQITFARSLDPIQVLDLSITRQARTTAARMQSGPTEMGRKAIVPYAAYRAHGFFSPPLAAQTGVTTDDLALLWEALQGLFEHDHSAARGEMAVRGLYVFTHESAYGNAPSHRLFDRIRTMKRDGVTEPRAFAHYQVTVSEDDLPTSVTLTRLVE